jgi:Flp pilus assembly pilin Flp
MKRRSLKDNFYSENGQGVTEYALILVFVMAASVLVLAVVGADVGDVFSRINFALGAAEDDSPPGTIEVSVIDANGNPVPDTLVYAFDGTGNWVGRSLRTNNEGIVLFEEMSDGSYQFQNYISPNYFWSNIITYPRENRATIRISMQQVTVRVEGGGGTGVPNVDVYAYTSNEMYWMGVNGRTDTNGEVLLNVPNGDYKFRANVNQILFWSPAITVPDQRSTVIPIQLQNVTVDVVDLNGKGIKQSNLYVYAYTDNGSYTGIYGQTNGNGRALLGMPAGKFTYRVSYCDHNYWSDVIRTPAQNTAQIRTGERPFTVTVKNDAGEPLRNVWVYAYSGNQIYFGLRGHTDQQGQTEFDIPDGSFMFRVDYNNTMHWSDVLSTPATSNTTIIVR